MRIGVADVVLWALPVVIVVSVLVATRRAAARDDVGRSADVAVDAGALAKSHRIGVAALVASAALFAVSRWMPAPSLWNAGGGVLLSVSMSVQFRTEKRKHLADLSFWTSVLSVVCLALAVLAVALPSSGEAGRTSATSAGRTPGSRTSAASPHDGSET